MTDTLRRIAAILGAYDDLIEVNRRRIALLEEMSRRLFEEWFVHFRFPERGKGAAVKSDLDQVPAGWEAAELETLITASYGYTASATPEAVGPKFLRVMDINKTSWIDWHSVSLQRDGQIRRVSHVGGLHCSYVRI